MKKLISLLLALVMILSLSTVAFAAESVGVQTLNKNYKLENTGTTAPDETFTFEIARDNVDQAASSVTNTNMPIPTIGSAAFTIGTTATVDEGTNVPITVTLPEYKSVGIYTYKIKEVAGNTAGVTYSDDEIVMKVTVINGDTAGTFAVQSVSYTGKAGTKAESFKNVYSAGSLAVSKTVTGNLGDKTKYFEFKVTLTGEEDKTYAESYAVTGGSNNTNPTSIKVGEETTFLLKDGDTIEIANLPYEVTYTVTETAAEGYTTKVGEVVTNEASGTINAATQTAAFTNDKKGDVDTGVVLDTLPYVMILAVAAVCGMALLLKKRHMAD